MAAKTLQNQLSTSLLLPTRLWFRCRSHVTSAKEPALFAGLDHATGEAIIPIDVDLQDPIEVIPHLIEKWQAGADMVLAKRSDRSTDSRLKRKSAEWFYKLHNKNQQPSDRRECWRLPAHVSRSSRKH